jgi:hypothetical protein
VLGLKTFTQNSRGEAKWGGGVEHFIGIREIFEVLEKYLGGLF